jgi:hypothetical protein
MQRKCALKRDKAAWKALSKKERAAIIELGRFSKYEEAEPQVGKREIFGFAAAAAATTAGVYAAGGFDAMNTAYSTFTEAVTAATQIPMELNETLLEARNATLGIRAVASAALPAVNAVSDTASFLTKTFEGLTAFMRKLQEATGFMFQLIAGAFMWAVSQMGLAVGIFKCLCEWVTTRCGVDTRVVEMLNPEGVQEQAGVSSLAYFATLVATVWMPEVKSERMIPEIMRRVSMAEKTGSGLEWLFSNALTLLDSVVNAILKMVGKDEIRLVDAVEREIGNWTKKVDEIQGVVMTSNPTPAQVREALVVMQEGIGLKGRVHAYAHRAYIDKYLDKLGSWMQAHRGAIMASNCYRQQPLFALFAGASGIGKTSCVVAMAATVAICSGLVKDGKVLEQMWQKGDSSYWNGYLGQLIYVMDDAFQRKNAPGAEGNEGMSIICAVNQWAYPLSYADVESKGRYYFASQLMLGTTNVYNVLDAVSQDVRHPEAVVRRIAYGYVMRLNPDGGFMLPNGQLDHEKLKLERMRRLAAVLESPNPTLEDICKSFPWEAWQLSKHGFTGHPSDAGWEPMFPVVMRMAADLSKREADHKEEVTQVEKYSEALSRFSNMDLSTLPRAQAGLEIEPEEEDEVDSPEQEVPSAVSTAADSTHGEVTILRDGDDEPPEYTSAPSASQEEAPFISIVGVLCRAASQFSNWIKSACAQLGITGGGVAFIALAGVALTTIYGLARVLCSAVSEVFKWMFGGVQQQSVHNEGKQAQTKRKYTRPQVEAQLGSPPEDVRQDIVYNNTYKVLCDGQALGQALFVRDRMCIMPLHFRTALGKEDPDSTVEFVSAAQSGHCLKLTVEQLLSFEHDCYASADIWFVVMARGCIQAHRDIVGYFLPEKSVTQVLSKKGNVPVRLDVARHRLLFGKHDLDRTVFLSNECVYGNNLQYTGGGNITDYFRYPAATKQGDCGAPLMLQEPRFWNGCILGMHVAGKADFLTRTGYATVVCRELVQEMCAKHKLIEDRFAEELAVDGIQLSPISEPEQLAHAQTGLIAGSFIGLGVVPTEYGVSLPVESKLKPSGYCGHGEPQKLPAKLRPFYSPEEGKMVFPMVKAVSGYQSPLVYKPMERLGSIVAMATKRHFELSKKCYRQVMSIVDAVVGIEGLKSKKIRRDTAAGWPWSKKYGAGKYAFFGEGAEYELSGPAWDELVRKVVHIVDSAKNNIRLAHIATDFLKDELRSPEKVATGATRLISGCSLSYTIAVRMYFYAFMVSMYETHTESGMAPGINNYKDWHKLGMNLSKYPCVFAGDFKGFDASEQPYVHYAILEYINRWYKYNNPDWKEEDDRVRMVLFQDLVHSRHLSAATGVATTVIQWNKALPSGHPLTTAVNSLYSLVTITAAYARQTGDYMNMWDRVFVCTYGDDNVQSTTPAVAEVFNQTTVSERMKEDFDLVYTSEKKDGTLCTTTTLDDVSFLKREIVQDEGAPGGWVAPLDEGSFLFPPYWFRNNRSGLTEVGENLQRLLEEAALHPADQWDRLTQPAYAYAEEHGIELLCYSREHACEIVYARTDWY